MSELEVTKKNGNVAFAEKEHVYWDMTDPTRKYTSVTTMIHSFTQPFDKEFWSSYKAVERLLGEANFKKEKGGILKANKVDVELLGLTYGFNKNEFNRTQQGILDEWLKKNQESCARGTAIHAELENKNYSHTSEVVKKYGMGGSFVCERNHEALDVENGLFPEYLIYNNEFGLAGQVDLVIKQGNELSIIDFKTNAKIDSTSGYDSKTKKRATMQYPLTGIMDCNLMHYTLQLSTYAYMLQQVNPEFKIKKLLIEHHDHNGKVNTIEVEYLKETVKMMIKAFNRKKELEARKDRRKPIIF